MTWIDDRLKDQKIARERKDQITEAAGNIYEALWKEIVKNVEEAKRKQIPAFTNGELYDRLVRMSTFNPASPHRDTHIRLTKDKNAIEVTNGPQFKLDVCPDGVVCLKDQSGRRTNIEEAARKILDPIFFPELQSSNS